MKIRFKKLSEGAVTPTKAHTTDAGFDLTTVGITDKNGSYIEYGTGIAVEIPAGYVGLIFPRSSISKYNHLLCNSVGVIDSGYHGEIKFRFTDNSRHDVFFSFPDERKQYQKGDKIGQLIIIPIPQIELEEVDNLGTSDRGTGGFGSSGN